MPSVSEPLPPLYAKWMDALFAAPIPREGRATCDDCAMCEPGPDVDAAHRGGEFFSPVTKCCTFLPELHNFLVGRILADDDPAAAAGRASVERRIDQRVAVTPLGLGRTNLFNLLYGESVPGSFGRATSLRCPHQLDDGRCGVWRHRESTCATWFCKYERGQTGRAFWTRLHALLGVIERSLVRHCLLELGTGLPLDKLFAARQEAEVTLSAADVDGRADREVYASLWGGWFGRERELYRRSAELVEPLGWDEVLALGGSELALAVRIARDAFRELVSQATPERVVHRELHTLHRSKDRVRVATYSGIDPLSLPAALVDVLPAFDGRPTQEVLDAIARSHGLRLRPGLVRKLLDFGLVDRSR